MTDQGFDIIGDIHGMVDVLKRLLAKLGYLRADDRSPFIHPENRQVIFVGDLIDRGENGIEVVEIAKAMTDAGSAITVMGNHELNAIFFAEEHPSGDYLRSHSEKNIEQHAAFLNQFKEGEGGCK